jgi:hypothetical protein
MCLSAPGRRQARYPSEDTLRLQRMVAFGAALSEQRDGLAAIQESSQQAEGHIACFLASQFSSGFHSVLYLSR